jgi:hypothetical protein
VFGISGVLAINALRLGFAASPVGIIALPIAFDEKALADTGRIDITIVP